MGRKPDTISPQTTARLPVYLRCLTLLEQEGVEYVSSRVLAERFHLSSAQIRKDLAHFGEFGIRGVGYSVTHLRQDIRRILGLTRRLGVVLIGAGRLGRALADYPGFRGEELELVAVLDSDPQRIGRVEGGIVIADVATLDEIVGRTGAEIAILAVPAAAAQVAADRAVRAGIRAILNFAPIGLRLPERIKVKQVDLKTEIEGLAFFLKEPGDLRGSGAAADRLVDSA